MKCYVITRIETDETGVLADTLTISLAPSEVRIDGWIEAPDGNRIYARGAFESREDAEASSLALGYIPACLAGDCERDTIESRCRDTGNPIADLWVLEAYQWDHWDAEQWFKSIDNREIAEGVKWLSFDGYVQRIREEAESDGVVVHGIEAYVQSALDCCR